MAKNKIAKENREALREELRKEGKDKRKRVRGKVRGVATALVALMSLSLLFGCATATPSSKAQTSKACGNTITVNIALVSMTNAVAMAALPAGGVTISLSDLIGTQVQSADAGRDDTNTQTASPANTSGVVGDKPIDTIGEVGKAAITGGASAAAKQAAKLVEGASATDTATTAAEKAAGCTTGNCNLTK